MAGPPRAARLLDAWRCGWRAACERWRTVQAPPEAPRQRTSFFDCDPDTLALPRSADDEDAREWYRTHFRSGWPRR